MATGRLEKTTWSPWIMLLKRRRWHWRPHLPSPQVPASTGHSWTTNDATCRPNPLRAWSYRLNLPDVTIQLFSVLPDDPVNDDENTQNEINC